MKRRRHLIEAAEVTRVRTALNLSKAQFASALGVARRTVIRGEERGLELPWRPDSTRAAVWDAWGRLAAEAADRQRARSPAKCHTRPPQR
jgi:DNA-binding XRE family transcriptional regulator